MQVIETMTPETAADRLRELGMKISPTVIRDGMRQGVFPFGDVIESEKSYRFLIYSRLFEAWVAARAKDREEG